MNTICQIGCGNGHKTNVMIPAGETVQQYLKKNVCEKCQAELHLVGFPDES